MSVLFCFLFFPLFCIRILYYVCFILFFVFSVVLYSYLYYVMFFESETITAPRFNFKLPLLFIYMCLWDKQYEFVLIWCVWLGVEQ